MKLKPDVIIEFSEEKDKMVGRKIKQGDKLDKEK